MFYYVYYIYFLHLQISYAKLQERDQHQAQGHLLRMLMQRSAQGASPRGAPRRGRGVWRGDAVPGRRDEQIIQGFGGSTQTATFFDGCMMGAKWLN